MAPFVPKTLFQSITSDGWVVDSYQTVARAPPDGAWRKFNHYVIYNHLSNATVKDVRVEIVGSSEYTGDQPNLVYSMGATFEGPLVRVLDRLREPAVALTHKDTIFFLPTTETFNNDLVRHGLWVDALNGNYGSRWGEVGDYTYAEVGRVQFLKHMQRLKPYGFVDGSSHVAVSGHSDGGWLASMLWYLGDIDHAEGVAGWSMAYVEQWKQHISPKSDATLNVYISAGDMFYDGSSGWYPAAGEDGSMLNGIQFIANYTGLVEQTATTVTIGGVSFQRTCYTGNQTICFHLDEDTTHTHFHFMCNDGADSVPNCDFGYYMNGLL